MNIRVVDAHKLGYRELNNEIRAAVAAGATTIKVEGACGQRYIGTGVNAPVNIEIYGTPGSDLAAFGNGPRITVYGNGQEAVGNTLNAGEIVIHGHVNDVLGVSMRGGRIFIRDYVGYRAGIHMKAYRELKPVIVIGGAAQHFLGEYMAGGVILVLGLGAKDRPPVGDYVGTGMHGGVIYIRGRVDSDCLGKEVSVLPLTDADWDTIRNLVEDYCRYFGGDTQAILDAPFVKLAPVTHRPYGLLYVP